MRDYSEVQKGKDIGDRIYGLGEGRKRLQMATGHDLLNAFDIKEGMEYADGVKNTKIAVAEIIPDTGIQSLDKKNFVFVHRIVQVVWAKLGCQIFPQVAQFAVEVSKQTIAERRKD